MHCLHTFKVNAANAKEAMHITEAYLADIAEAASKRTFIGDDGEEYEDCPGFDYYTVFGALDIKTDIREASLDPLFAMGRGATWLAIYGTKEGLLGVYDQRLSWEKITDDHTTLEQDNFMENGLTNVNVDKDHPTTHIVLADFHL